jgi:hypothetical protein
MEKKAEVRVSWFEVSFPVTFTTETTTLASIVSLYSEPRMNIVS